MIERIHAFRAALQNALAELCSAEPEELARLSLIKIS